MNRIQKQELIEKLDAMYTQNQFVFLVSINAVNASSALSFRADIRKNNSSAMVAKNTLSKIVARKLGMKGLDEYFSKQILTIFTNNPVEIAKLLGIYEEKGYKVVGGSDKATLFSIDDVKKLAKVPSMPVLRSMLLSTILSVHRKTVCILSESGASLVRLIATRSKS